MIEDHWGGDSVGLVLGGVPGEGQGELLPLGGSDVAVAVNDDAAASESASGDIVVAAVAVVGPCSAVEVVGELAGLEFHLADPHTRVAAST